MINTNLYYEILGVNKNSSEDEIKKAYRKQSLKHHPDRGGNNEQFQKINTAYEVLKDPKKRHQYDMGIDPDSLNQTGPDISNIFDILSQMRMGEQSTAHIFASDYGMPFGVHPGMNMHYQQRMQKPASIVKNIEIDIFQSYTGCTLPLEIIRWTIENNAKKEETETIYISIPPGIDDGEMLVMREKGNIINDDNKGDIKIFIKVKNTTEFQRKGLDIIYNKRITLKDALCGFIFEVNHINGKSYKITNGNGNTIIPNYKKLLPNMGFKRDNHNGNFIIIFEIIFPEKLTEDQIKVLENIL